MAEVAAGEEDRQILGGVAAAIAEVAPQKDGGALEQAAALFLGLPQLSQQTAHCLQGFGFHDLELRQLAGILAMVGQVVMTQIHAFDGWSEGISGEHDGDDPCRIRVQGEVAEVEEKPGAPDEVGGVGDVRGRLRVHLGFGGPSPALVVDHAHLQLADAGKVFVEFFAVLTADLGSEGMGLSADVVENAASIIEPLKLGLDGVGFPLEKESGEYVGRGIVRRDERRCVMIRVSFWPRFRNSRARYRRGAR